MSLSLRGSQHEGEEPGADADQQADDRGEQDELTGTESPGRTDPIRFGGRRLASSGHHSQGLGKHLLGTRVLGPAFAGGPRIGGIGHECDSRMMSPSFATALLAVDFTVPFDSPVVSAISASDRPP